MQSFCAETCACASVLTPEECNDAAGLEYLSAIPVSYTGIFNAACGSDPTTRCCDGYDPEHSGRRRLSSESIPTCTTKPGQVVEVPSMEGLTADSFFLAADTDKDHLLTLEEYSAEQELSGAEEFFLAADKDKDHLLTREEYTLALNAMPDHRGGPDLDVISAHPATYWNRGFTPSNSEPNFLSSSSRALSRHVRPQGLSLNAMTNHKE